MKTYIGLNSNQQLKEIIEENQFKKIFLVTNRNSFSSHGPAQYIYQNITGCQYHRFHEYDPNPQLADLMQGHQECIDFRPDLIIGIGGGSAMDMAKLIHLTSRYNKLDEKIMKSILKEPHQKIPQQSLCLIPTTSGSGSEATQFAVIYINGKKHSLDTSYVLPEYSIIDAYFTEKLPKNISAYTGIDAICQAIESYWAVKSTKESKDYALKAIDLLVKNIEKVYRQPDLESRQAMADGAFYAGKAINITRTTAAHAFSYYLTSKFSYPHGHAVGLLLPYFIIENAKLVDLKEIYQRFDVNNAYELQQTFITLMDNLNLYKDLSELIKDHEHDFIASVNLERLKNNPAQFSKEEYLKLFQQKLK